MLGLRPARAESPAAPGDADRPAAAGPALPNNPTDDPTGERKKKSTKLGSVALMPNQVRGDEYTPESLRATERGLAWLAKRQAPDGSYSRGDGTTTGHAGVTALAALAMMEGGSLPGRGPYGKEVQKALDFVLSCCQRDGLISTLDDTAATMYGHGFATLFLGEIYGMAPNEELKEKLQKAVVLIERTQNARGGWRYQPRPYDDDISVTIAEIMALRAARDAGIKVEKEVIDKAVAYVKMCQNQDGSFNYLPGQWEVGIGASVFRGGAGCASLYYCGEFDGEHLRRGLEWLRACRPEGKGGNSSGSEPFLFYGYYYAVQAMFLAGGEYWAEFWPPVREWLVKKQGADGSWSGEVSPDFSTAMALIILQQPNRYLPVFAGKGPGS
jgi:hypothetical protein